MQIEAIIEHIDRKSVLQKSQDINIVFGSVLLAEVVNLCHSLHTLNPGLTLL